jgi:hypothetical protein
MKRKGKKLWSSSNDGRDLDIWWGTQSRRPTFVDGEFKDIDQEVRYIGRIPFAVARALQLTIPIAGQCLRYTKGIPEQYVDKSPSKELKNVQRV